MGAPPTPAAQRPPSWFRPVNRVPRAFLPAYKGELAGRCLLCVRLAPGTSSDVVLRLLQRTLSFPPRMMLRFIPTRGGCGNGFALPLTIAVRSGAWASCQGHFRGPRPSRAPPWPGESIWPGDSERLVLWALARHFLPVFGEKPCLRLHFVSAPARGFLQNQRENQGCPQPWSSGC